MKKWNELPRDIREMMLQRQVEQGNKRDESVFEGCIKTNNYGGGFYWEETPECHAVWEAVMDGNYQRFYDLHGKPCHPQYMAIKIADENEFNQVAKVLKGLGYIPSPEPEWGSWEDKGAQDNFHVITYLDRTFDIHSHKGSGNQFYTFSEFIENFSPIPSKPQLTRKEVEDKYGIEVVD
jgi:hypothetical protein